MDDAQILSGLQKQDEAAFKTLFYQLSPLVKFYANKLTDNNLEAEDITSLAFAKLWQKDLAEFESISQIKNFVFSVARNSSIDYLRKESVKNAHKGNIAYLTPIQEEQIKTSDIEVELLRRLYDEIELLPKRTREVFTMVYVFNLSRNEVADKLQISASTVRSLLSEAINKLKGRFTETELMTIFFLLSLQCYQEASQNALSTIF